ncbi:MAG: PQQ-binding-like beta-propeller repeat protein [Verrucomicrobiota bacterium]
MKGLFIGTLFLFLGCTTALPAPSENRPPTHEWPQWLGPKRDAVWRESGIVESLATEPLPVVWRTPIHAGHSGPSVSGNRVFVTDFVLETGSVTNRASAADRVTGKERILCLNADTGKEIWSHSYPVEYSVSYPGGPRTSPLVLDGRVYTVGTAGDLFAIDTESGKVLWSKNFESDYTAKVPFWGHSAHPIVAGDALVCMVGGEGATVVAFDLETGEEKWKALDAAEPGYAPPAIAKIAGAETLLVWHPESLNALDPESGSLRWSVPLPARSGMSVTAPLAIGNDIYVSGIGTEPALVRVAKDGKSADFSWRGGLRAGITSGNSSPLVYNGILFGVDMQGRLIASSLADGSQLWKTYKATTGERSKSYATAFLVRHEDKFFIFNESGDLIHAELTEDGYTELGRVSILPPTTKTYGRDVLWSHPAFAHRSLFARNDKEIVRVSLATEK